MRPRSTDGNQAAADDWSALMAAAQSGDRAAYRALLVAAVPYVQAIAAGSFQDRADVEDVVQDVLTTLHATRGMFDPSRPFRPWLAAIARRRIVDRLRRDLRRQRREVPMAPLHETLAADPANSPESTGDGATLRAALARLPAGQRQAIELMKLQELSLQEAALATGLSVTALKVATHRAVKRLRRLLALPPDGEAA
jgi:RNA polymerase sigma-70 factor (ECF subfamily)